MPDRWLTAIIEDVKGRMKDALPDIVAGIKDGLAPQMAPEPPKPSLQAFLQASPDERLAFWGSVPPEDYEKVTNQFMDEANMRFGAMSKVLMPLFADGQANSLIQHAQIGQATGVDANLGVAAAHNDMIELLGIDPFSP